MTRGRLTAVLAIAFSLLMLATPAAAATTINPATLNYDGDARAPNPVIEGDVTKSTHKMGWDPVAYEADNGEKTMLPATVNTSQDNPYSYTVTDINASEFGAFPRKSEDDNSASALDASEWTTTDLTTSDVTTAPGVDAVEFATNGSMGAGDTASATYSNFSITSDAEKRMIQLGVTVDSLEAGATVDIRIKDSDGDWVNVTIDPDMDPSTENVLANSTGDGWVLQRQVGKMTVHGTGDGTMQELQKIEVVVTGGDANVDAMLVNLEKMSKYTFGETKEDTDGDDALETTTIRETTTAGDVNVHSLASLGSTFDDAAIHDLTIGMRFRAQDLSETDGDVTDIAAEFESADDYPAYDKILDVHYRLELPDAYDLSYSSMELVMEQQWPGARYTVVETAEGIGSTDFGNVSSWSGQASSFSSQDSEVSLDATVTVGTQYGIHIRLLLTSSEASAITSASAGGAAPMGGGGGGGLFDMIFGLPGFIAGVSISLVQWFRGGWPFSR